MIKYGRMRLLLFTVLLPSVFMLLFVEGVEAVTVKGTDAIFLAGRTDVTIPPLGSTDPSFPLVRHSFVLPSFTQETFPAAISASGGETFTFSASGGIDYFNTVGSNITGPDGVSFSNLFSVGGISGYRGPQGSLVGVFLDNSIPSNGPAPSIIDYSALGTSFSSAAPSIRQVFFIGDGLTGTRTGTPQTFVAPQGATRLYLGIADGGAFGAFLGPSGAYEDNDGAFIVTVNPIPEPSTLLLLATGLLALLFSRKQFVS